MKFGSLASRNYPARPLAWVVLAAGLCYVLTRGALLIAAIAFDPAATVDLILDDAYFYLTIAYNIGQHGRSTFDGITDTNGYQPAWMVLLAALEGVLRLEKKGLFVALQGLVLLVTVLPFLYCMKRRRDPFYLALGGGLIAGYACYPTIFLFGLETALFAPAIVAVADVARNGINASAARVAWLFALIVWIRLDAVSLLLGYAAVLAYQSQQSAGLRVTARRVALFLLPSLLSLGLYALANWLVFGVPVPISGLAKAIGAPAFSNWGIIYYYALQSVPVLGLSLLVLLVEAVWGKFEDARWLYTGVCILLASLVPHYLYYAAFSGWILWPWYFYSHALLSVLMGARLIAIAQLPRLASSSAGRRAQLVIATLIVLGGMAFPVAVHGTMLWQLADNQRRGGTPSGSFNRRNVADALEFERSGEQATVAMGDRVAGLGYWAPPGVHVFALEGLVANRAYLEARRRDDAARWLKETIRPDYLIVDREFVPLVRVGDSERYIIIEPVQGRVVLDHLVTFCFPPAAVLKETRIPDTQIEFLPAPARRLTFDMRRAEQCSGGHAHAAREAVISSPSLRRSANAADYATYLGGDWAAALERFDRRLALSLRRRSD
jgi:hypothetical protein